MHLATTISILMPMVQLLTCTGLASIDNLLWAAHRHENMAPWWRAVEAVKRRILHFLWARSHEDSLSPQHHVTAVLKQAASGLRVICCGHGKSEDISADSKEHQQSECIAEVSVCSPSPILTVAGHITLSMVCCRDYPTSAEDYELLEEAGRGVSATVSGHIVLAANVYPPGSSRTQLLP